MGSPWGLPSFTGFSPHFPAFSQALLDFYRVLPSLIWFNWILPGFTGLYWVLLGFYFISLRFVKFYWVSNSCSEFYLVLLGFTGFYRVLPSFIPCFEIVPSALRNTTSAKWVMVLLFFVFPWRVDDFFSGWFFFVGLRRGIGRKKKLASSVPLESLFRRLFFFKFTKQVSWVFFPDQPKLKSLLNLVGNVSVSRVFPFFFRSARSTLWNQWYCPRVT